VDPKRAKMKIITDLKYIKEMAKKRDEENWEFRAFLKQIDKSPKEIDATVQTITDQVTSQIDCTSSLSERVSGRLRR
jgi:esterase/lipase